MPSPGITPVSVPVKAGLATSYNLDAAVGVTKSGALFTVNVTVAFCDE